MTANPEQFDWMREALYEPPPLRRAEAPRFWIAFWILAAIAVTCCGLAGLAL